MNEKVNLAMLRRASGRKTYWLFGTLAALGLAAVVLIATFLFGHHGGEEFSPDTFTRRLFYYFQIPLLGIQVTPILREDTTNALENYVLANRFVVPNSPDNPRWDLVRAFSAGSGIVRGDAEILCNYLDATDQNQRLYWQRWSDSRPEAARVLWPLVARLARQQLYLFVPELFELAAAESDPDVLAGKLKRSLAQQYHRLAKIHGALGNHDAALELRDQARMYEMGGPPAHGHESP